MEFLHDFRGWIVGTVVPLLGGAIFVGAKTEIGAKAVDWAIHKLTKKKKRRVNMFRVAVLSQQVKDLKNVIKGVLRELRNTRKDLRGCDRRHAECQADYKNLLRRIMVLENK